MKRHKGFSLLEILVAFAIMAVALTIVLRIFGSGVNNAVISEDYTLAVQIAESLMARTGVEAPLQIGESTGREGDKFDWRVIVRPVAKSNPGNGNNDDAQGPTLELVSVSVQVDWGDDDGARRTLELSSLRTMRVEEP